MEFLNLPVEWSGFEKLARRRANNKQRRYGSPPANNNNRNNNPGNRQHNTQSPNNGNWIDRNPVTFTLGTAGILLGGYGIKKMMDKSEDTNQEFYSSADDIQATSKPVEQYETPAYQPDIQQNKPVEQQPYAPYAPVPTIENQPM